MIVGRLGAYILKDRANTFDIFLTGARPFRAERLTKRYGISFDEALKTVRKDMRYFGI